MQRKKATEFSQDILDMYDAYAHGRMSKRDFLTGASKYAVGGMTAMAIYDAMKPNYALANQVAPDDPAIMTETVSYNSPNGQGEISGLLAKPSDGPDKLPAVLVIHENRGLNPYIEDVARRLAKQGFLALAPDGLSPIGGYPGNDDEGKAMQKSIDGAKLLEDFFAGFDHIMSRPDSTGNAGAVGFCYGGGVCNALAVNFPEMKASVPFYGRQAAAEDVPRIQAPLLIQYAGLDERINKGWPDYEAALKANGKEYTAHIYPDVNHGFHNDTTPRYDAPAAMLAQDRTIAFFKEKLV